MVDTSHVSFSEPTLDDDAWKDSFDKLLDLRPALRELNIIKKDVRASLNIDSSVENCSRNNSLLIVPPNTAPVPVTPSLAKRKIGSISTPNLRRLEALNPFKCSLSPVGVWKFRYFNNDKPKNIRENISASAQTTPIDLENCVIHYEDVDSDASEQKRLPSGPIRKKSCLNTRKTRAVPVIKFVDDAIERKLDDLSRVSELPKTFGKGRKSKRKTSQVRVTIQTTSNAINADGTELRHSKRNRKTVSTMHNHHDAITEQHLDVLVEKAPLKDKDENPKILNPGKWRKSLYQWRRTCANKNRASILRQSINKDDSVEFVGLAKAVGQRKSFYFKTERQSELEVENWEQRVLELCRQSSPELFSELYGVDNMHKCRKAGEGVYGEVFIYATHTRKAVDVVVKIIPIEGKGIINGEPQKTYQEIYPEIKISMELSSLNNSNQHVNTTNGFVGIQRVACVKGKYPVHLVKLWEIYDENTGSENEHPAVFDDGQLYVVLELEYGGQDLEKFVFENAKQAYYALQQVIIALAVAEESFQFEHRDLHWGNILIKSTRVKQMKYRLQNDELVVPTMGIKVTIIDYTLSRMTHNDCCLYNDLSNDEELFTAVGDYQFDIYRMMRDVLKNNWETYEPKTNVFWISYVVTKLIDGVRYKNTQSKLHLSFMAKLKALYEIVLNFKSATECAKYLQEAE